MALNHDRSFDPRHGEAVPVADDVLRVTAPNASAFTFKGTNSYIVGRDTLAVIDPGPDDSGHLGALLRAINGRHVSHILLTHTHVDHSLLVPALVERTGARTVAEGPHRAARPLLDGEIDPLDASADRAFAPDIVLGDGEAIEGDGWQLRAVATPGHTMNHLAFAFEGTGILFSGDHVMGWSTSIVAPPDGSMPHYMASLDRLLAREDALYLPGHGGAIERPRPYVKGLKTHRIMREGAILDRVRAGDGTILRMVERIYHSTDKRLHGAAALSVLAHLEDLVARGLVQADGAPTLQAWYEAL